MEKNQDNKKNRLQVKSMLIGMLRYWWVAALVLGIWGITLLYDKVAETPPVKLEVVRNTRIDLTPEEISSIKDIGQWEFLSVATEEMAEWHKTSTFGDSHLVRIYQGTLRIGIDMDRCREDWFTSLEDSAALLKLPAAGLLDDKFIDEARSRSFYEKGKFSPEVYEELYRQAEQAMRRRCLTPQNIKRAEESAREHFTKIFKSLGFKKVDIQFIPSK